VLQFNRPVIEQRISRLAAYLELPEPGFAGFLSFVLRLRAEVGVPHTLPELGVDNRQAQRIAEMAEADPSAGGNPLPFKREAAAAVFAAAQSGSMDR
jgi:alcohol dehydrogenase